MTVPFSRDEFFAVFVSYNDAVWPAQIILIAIAVMIVAAACFSPRARWPVLALAGLWIWMGVVYHIGFFSRINSAAFLFGALFILQGVIMGAQTLTGSLRFAVPRDPTSVVTGALLLVYALIGYPVLAAVSGQLYPAVPTFGLPCPTTIFTLGMLTWSPSRVRHVMIIPVLWAVVGTSAAAQLGVVEDWGLPVAAIAVILVRLRGNRRHAAGRLHRVSRQ